MDFVIYPLNPDFVKSAEERLDVKDSFTKLEYAPPSIESEKLKIRVSKDLIFFEDDETSFDTMILDDRGNIMIWTDTKVWFLQRFSGMEKLHYVPRHPSL
jgi:hypothetical protein